MMPWLRRIEIGLSKALPDGVDVVFDTAPLLRADSLTRARVDYIRIQSGTLNPNESRVLDGREPYDGGDVFNQSLPGTVTAGGDIEPLGDLPATTAVMGVLE